jgi:hypothetical protein
MAGAAGHRYHPADIVFRETAMVTTLFRVAPLALALTLIACDQTADDRMQTTDNASGRVHATGKRTQDLASVPAEVIAAAKAARPKLQVAEVEHEQRDGNDYYDVAGTVDGAELELDITRIDGRWTVVEVQRDVTTAEVPPRVAVTLAKAHPEFKARRIIESDEGNGIVIYEFFGPGSDGRDRKIEVKIQNGEAEVLTAEWVH